MIGQENHGNTYASQKLKLSCHMFVGASQVIHETVRFGTWKCLRQAGHSINPPCDGCKSNIHVMAYKCMDPQDECHR